jgi:hypothetical protein
MCECIVYLLNHFAFTLEHNTKRKQQKNPKRKFVSNVLLTDFLLWESVSRTLLTDFLFGI